MRFSDSFIEELCSRNEIVPIVSEYLDLRPSGRLYSGLCPFHGERTPSFYVYPESNSYYCFGCGKGGSVLGFVRDIENLDFEEAVRMLCERSGMHFPTASETEFDNSALRRRCREANREAARFFHASLYSDVGGYAREYLKNRALSDETVAHFGLGFAPDSWTALTDHMKSKGFSETELISFDLARRSSKGNVIDAFRNRLMFPIIDLRGNVIAFGGRVFDDSKPKYLNTSDTICFNKSRELFALNFAKKNDGALILCEGYMDVISMHQAGFTTAVAGLGTSFTADQANLLRRYCDTVMLCFDSDEAGKRATERAIKLLSDVDIRVRVINITGGKDPDEILRTEGRGAMQRIIDASLNNTEFELSKASGQYDLTTDDGKLKYFNAVCPVIAAIRNDVERDLYISRTASLLGVSKDSVISQVKRQRSIEAAKAKQELTVKAKKNVAPVTARETVRIFDRAEEILLADIINSPDMLNRLGDRLNDDCFLTETGKKCYALIKERSESGGEVTPAWADALDSELARAGFARLFAVGLENEHSVKECLECISSLKTRKTSAARNVSEMSNDEFAKMISALSKRNNGG